MQSKNDIKNACKPSKYKALRGFKKWKNQKTKFLGYSAQKQYIKSKNLYVIFRLDRF